MKHSYGGSWTRTKLEYLSKYLRIYTTALKNQPFNLHYVDAFAGTGNQNTKLDGMQDTFLPDEDFDGSVKISLEDNFKFDQYHFNDLDPERVSALEALSVEYPNKKISITKQDANEFVSNFCGNMRWNDRAVLFLDPFSTELNWETLTAVAETEKIDLWLLFPISVILRMTPTDKQRVKPEWKDTLNRLLGTDDWENALYKEIKGQTELFGGVEDIASERINVSELTEWVKNRLEEKFPFVSSPVPLNTANNAPLFLFFFVISNDAAPAVKLARKLAREVLKLTE